MWSWEVKTDRMFLRDADWKLILCVHEKYDSVGRMPSDEHAKLIATAGMIPELVELLREFVNHNPTPTVMANAKKVLEKVKEALE